MSHSSQNTPDFFQGVPQLLVMKLFGQTCAANAKLL